MRNLNLPEYELSLREQEGHLEVFDAFRKRYVRYTPEEEVRQRLAHYLVEEKGYPASLIRTEHSLVFNKMTRRCDILVDKPAGAPALLVECKAPEVSITQAAFDQAARYNQVFRVQYLILSNGMKHYACKMDLEKQKVIFLKEIPAYKEL